MAASSVATSAKEVADRLVLPVGKHEKRRRGELDVVVLRVLNEADDLHVGLFGHAHALAYRGAPEVELLRESLVDDGDLWRAERIRARELAAGEERDPERPEVTDLDGRTFARTVRP